MQEDRCQVKKCKRSSEVIYLGREVCDYHWEKHCDSEDRFNLKVCFNIPIVRIFTEKKYKKIRKKKKI